MDILFYDFDFNRLAECTKPISVNFEKCYCGYGCVEVHFDISRQDIISLLESNEFLFFVTKCGSAIVTGWQFGEDIAIYARTPEWLLTKRGIGPISFSDTNSEEIVRSVFESIPDFVALDEVLGVGRKMDFSTLDVRTLLSIVCDVLKPQGLGFEVFPEISQKRFVLRVRNGEMSQCTFSLSNRTAYNMEYTVEKQDAVTNSGWFESRYINMGNWNASSNSPMLLNNQPSNAYTFYKIASSGTISRFGLSCTQGMYLFCDNQSGVWKVSDTKPETIWVYIDNEERSGLKKWDAVLNGIKTMGEAKTEISVMSGSSDTACEVYRLEYEKDYHLGDFVFVQLEIGDFKKVEKKRVVSVDIYYDTDKCGVSPKLESVEG